MAHKIKGEAQSEKGLGLPLTTTADRLVYTPPQSGYMVYDTDLDEVFYWDDTAWNNLSSNVPPLEYINVYRNGNVNVADNTAIPFNLILSGSIPYNGINGQFTLTGGTTYLLRGNVNPRSTSRLNNAWYDVTASSYISPSGSTASASVLSDNGSNQAEVIYTPAVNSIVELRNRSGATRNVAGADFNTAFPASQAMIISLGTP